jgi:hypothetical protein
MIVINTISGYAASSRKKADTLAGFISDIVNRQQYMSDWPLPPVEIFDYFSSHRDCINESRGSLYAGNLGSNRIQYIGKSMGGVKTWWMLTKHWEQFKRYLEDDDAKIGVTLIDPHGAQKGDGKIGSYGTFLQKELPMHPDWKNHPNFKIQCLYQRDKYPRGAKLAGFSPNIKLGNSNHWDVTKLGTESGEIVAISILEQLKWLSQ